MDRHYLLDSLCVLAYTCLGSDKRLEGGAYVRRDESKGFSLKTPAATGTVSLEEIF
jgi:hypothetical protein